MKHLTDLFKLAELTRNQAQYGYVLSGIGKHDLSDLAQHHYLVTFIAWQLARQANAAGASINVERVMEYALVHDLAELFGSDISMPYALANPQARKAAKQFEAENEKFLSRFFGPDAKHFSDLNNGIVGDGGEKPDELIIAKLADYIECTHYKFLLGKFRPKDMEMVVKKMETYLGMMRDRAAQKMLRAFVEDWQRDLPGRGALEAIEGMTTKSGSPSKAKRLHA